MQRACGEGRPALAYSCCYIPEVLLDIEGCFGVRPRAMGSGSIAARKQFLYCIAKEYRADGIIAENMKFCEYRGYERAQAAQWMNEGFNVPEPIPVCRIEKDYANAAAGQPRGDRAPGHLLQDLQRLSQRDMSGHVPHILLPAGRYHILLRVLQKDSEAFLQQYGACEWELGYPLGTTTGFVKFPR